MFTSLLFQGNLRVLNRCICKIAALRCKPNTNFAQTIALRAKKSKSGKTESKYYVDTKAVRVFGGKGGDGCVSFLQLWCNECAGPDGGDGGHGGHVIFQASAEKHNLNHVRSTIKGEPGERGNSKDCHGKNAEHIIIKVPIGTVIRDIYGRIVGDLNENGLMFVASRGGAGGKGNRFFATSTEKSPQVCEYGPSGEDNKYFLELRSVADIGLIGLPNVGKSTLLNAISRAQSKVAPHPFTTLRPHIGIVQYKDYTSIAVADLPGLFPGSHKNKGLGIQFLRHAERSSVLVLVLDASKQSPWTNYDQVMHELMCFSPQLAQKPTIIVANKMDLPPALDNVKELERRINQPVIPISAKTSTNLQKLLSIMREYYELYKSK